MTPTAKDSLKKEIVQSLKSEKEIKKIMIFGSFSDSEKPNDIDVAVFQDSKEAYLTLALKYRKLIRSIIRKIPVDIIPIRANISESSFLAEIESGELIYEK
ncbi:MAG: nucleotidyltransferase domain-containing protein [Methanosarcinaceae archaeon]